VTQPSSYPGRPQTPAPGVAAPELRVARLRAHAARLTWSAAVLVAVAGATGYFSGTVPPFVTEAGAPVDALAGTAVGDVTVWALVVWAAAVVVVVLLVLVPYLRWLGHTYTITTRRVVEQSGLVRRERRELTHARGYTIAERRGPLQRLWGSGTLVLSNGVEAPLVLRNVPSVRLVHETLADQVEISQILAHRDSHGIPTVSGSA
jgi:membrane protein YdbS with pleckstrin-like domain